MLHTPHARATGSPSTIALAVSASARDSALAAEHVTDEDMCGRAVECDLAAGEELGSTGFVAVYTEREEPRCPGRPRVRRRPVGAERRLRRAVSTPIEPPGPRPGTSADVEIDGDQDAQLGVRFAAAELIAVAPTDSSRSSIGAKGLTGDGYKGHVFWDTDIFQLPFFAAVKPEIARRIVEYRVLTLDAARRNAENAGLDGAWYAWESAATGEDVTPVVRDRAGRPPARGAHREPGDPRRRPTSPGRSRRTCAPPATRRFLDARRRRGHR